MAEIPNPWDPMPDEPADAYAAFQEYLSIEGKRSIQKVAQKVQKVRQTVDKWAHRWDWRNRAYQWDAARTHKAFADEVAKEKQRLNALIIRKHQVGKALESLMIKALSRLSEKIDGDSSFYILPRDLTALVDLGFTLQSTEIPTFQDSEHKRSGIEQLADSLRQLAASTLRKTQKRQRKKPASASRRKKKPTSVPDESGA